MNHTSDAPARELQSTLNDKAKRRPPKPTRPTLVQQAIPPELRALDRWVCWRYTWKPKEGKYTKVPIDPKTGRAGSSTNPKTWATHKAACAAYVQSESGPNPFDGIGLVVIPDDDLVGVDLDGCLSGTEDAGLALAEWARPIVEGLASYTEVTPSGRGLRVWVRGDLPPGGRKKTLGDGQAIEVYSEGRYLTATGCHWKGSPRTVEARPAELAEMHGRIFPPKSADDTLPAAPKPAPTPHDLSDDELIRKASSARNGAAFAALFAGDTSAHQGDDSAADLALCRALAFWFGGDAAAIDRVFRRSGLMRPKWDERRGARTYGELTTAKALEGLNDVYSPRRPKAETNGDGKAHTNGKAHAGDGPPDPPTSGVQSKAKVPKRPEIEVNTQRHRVLAETLAALPGDPDLYARGNVLVRIAREHEDTVKLGGVKLRHALGMTRVVMMAEAGLSCRLTGMADFFAWFPHPQQKMEAVSKPAHPPTWLVKAVLENGSYPGVRPLLGVAEVPFPRPDGSIVETAGYDRATGVFHAPSVAVRPIPDRPTQEDAVEAAALLYALVRQFPFATDDDQAVWLAALLTVMARPAIDGPCPGTAFIANKAGTGKGRLIDTLATIVTGRPVPTTSYPRDDSEASKIKCAFALAATAIVHLDNLDEGRTYGGGVLDSTLTSLTVSERILGQSKSTEGIELRCVWFLSGNNVAPSKDAYRRWLVCNLMTDLERPEERDDLEIPDLLAHVREHRGELVRAALVILRAHAVAGRPKGKWAPLGSFEEWDRIVRGAVWFATGRDCNTTRRQAAEEAPDRQAKLALLEAWRELPNGGHKGLGVTSEEAYRLAVGEKDHPAEVPSLAEVLSRFTRDGKFSPRNIGNTIRAMRGQNFEGLKFRSVGQHKRSALWVVDSTRPSTPNNQKAGESGESGESDSHTPRARTDSNYDVMVSADEGPANQAGLESDSPDSPDSPGQGGWDHDTPTFD